MIVQVAIFVPVALVALYAVRASRQRHPSLESVIEELRRLDRGRFDQERLAALSSSWQHTTEELDALRRKLSEVVGGVRGFMAMRHNAALINQMLEFFSEPVDGEQDEEVPRLITEIAGMVISVRSRTVAAIIEAMARPMFRFPFHGMQAVAEYRELVNTVYQLVIITQPRMVERLEFVL